MFENIYSYRAEHLDGWFKALPWETTDKYIRSGHRNPTNFEQDSLRIIMLFEEEGIKAVIGKPKGKDTTAVESYLSDKNTWTFEKAKAWFRKDC
jgi:hypothetical protein